MWTRKKKTLPTEPVQYPVGTFVESEKGYFYIVSDSKRYRISSKRVLDSWSPQRVVKTSEAALAKYRISFKMKFRNGTLVHNLGDGRIYLIEQGKRRPMVSPEAFERIGASRSYKDVVAVSAEEMKMHEIGDEIN